MENAQAGHAVRRTTRSRARELPFEFMLNALRLSDGFALALLRRAHRPAAAAIARALAEAERRA